MTACDICKGACCERMAIDTRPLTEMLKEYFEARGERVGTTIFLNQRCNCLSNGKCSIQEIKPKICSDYQVGSTACVKAIRWKHNDRTQKKIFSLFPTS